MPHYGHKKEDTSADVSPITYIRTNITLQQPQDA